MANHTILLTTKQETDYTYKGSTTTPPTTVDDVLLDIVARGGNEFSSQRRNVNEASLIASYEAAAPAIRQQVNTLLNFVPV